MVNAPAVEILDLDLLALAVDSGDLVACAHLDLEAAPKELRGSDDEVGLLLDHVADVVGQPAIGERDEVASVEYDDLAGLVEPACARCRRSAAGNAADDQNAFE